MVVMMNHSELLYLSRYGGLVPRCVRLCSHFDCAISFFTFAVNTCTKIQVDLYPRFHPAVRKAGEVARVCATGDGVLANPTKGVPQVRTTKLLDGFEQVLRSARDLSRYAFGSEWRRAQVYKTPRCPERGFGDGVISKVSMTRTLVFRGRRAAPKDEVYSRYVERGKNQEFRASKCR